MKIHGTDQTNFNPYRDHIQKNLHNKSEKRKKDQLEISNEAQKLQKNDQSDERKRYVKAIKQKIDAGDYDVNYERTAQKVIDFWQKWSL